jgi:hypothetical protein
MKKVIISTILLLLIFQSFSQEIIKTVLRDEDPFSLYLNDNKSESLSYYDLTPEKNNGTVIILLSGFFRNAKEVFNRTNLPQIAFENNITTLIPTINSRIHSDFNCFELINEMILDYSKRKDITVENIIVGGLSAGGILSLTYTIWMINNPHEIIPAPKACFTVDSPVDLFNFWFIEKRTAERNCSDAAVSEANYVLQYFNKYMGGTPESFPETYKKASPYSRSEKDGGNIIYLQNTPIRAYCEPDIDYHLKKCEDYFDMNASDLSAMINQLKMLGNDNAELITTVNKGYRLDGTRHPHSWSILDSKECIIWINKLIK